MKLCIKCESYKNLKEFHNLKISKDGKQKYCKICRKIYYTNEEYKNHKRLLDKYSYDLNKLQKLKYSKDYYKNNKDKVNKYYNTKRSLDINFKLKQNLRSRLNKALKNNYKSGSAVQDLGCSIEFLKYYLESKFQPGMSWENYGQWHIDHIKPLSKFNLQIRSELLEVCHYTNLQPLWKLDNISKGNRGL